MEQLSLGFDIPGLSQATGDLVTEVNAVAFIAYSANKPIFMQIAFNCPTGTTAGDYVTAGVPVWRYQYDGIDFLAILRLLGVNPCISSYLSRYIHITRIARISRV